MAEVVFESHLGEFLDALPEQIEQALIAIGMTAETHAKELCPVDTGRLRNSITHEVDMNDQSVIIGSNVEYAKYVELGTGQYAEGGGGRKTPWSYQDDQGNWHRTSGNRPQPYLRPACQNYRSEYKSLVESALKS